MKTEVTGEEKPEKIDNLRALESLKPENKTKINKFDSITTSNNSDKQSSRMIQGIAIGVISLLSLVSIYIFHK